MAGLGQEMGTALLDLASCGGCGLATDARRIHCFGGYEVEVFVVWDLVQTVAILQQLDV